MGNIRNSHISPGIYTSMRGVERHSNRYTLRDVKSLGTYKKQSSGQVTTIWVFGDLFPAILA